MTITESTRAKGQGHHPARVSVVICCYRDDRFTQLLASFDSVTRQSLPAHEIIIAVDHNPALERRVRSARPSAIVVQSNKPKGLSGARNAGLEAATEDIVAFLDDDATAEPDWLMKLMEAYRDSTVIGVGGGAIPRWASSEPRWLPEAFYWVIGCSWQGLPVEPSRIRNLIGCNMSFRREPCVKAGGFASEFSFEDGTLPNEETEFCVRLTQHEAPRQLVFLPDAVVRHEVPEERSTFRYFVKRCWREGRAKRITSKLVGSSSGLARERAHLQGVIPKAIVAGIRDCVAGDPTGLERVLALIAGTAVTVAAFLLPNRPAPHRSR